MLHDITFQRTKKKRENLMMLHDKSIQRTNQSSNKTPGIVSNYKTHKKRRRKKNKLTYSLSRFIEKVQRFQEIKGEVDFG